jgi:predicted ArsR family transcriptional regulator
MALPRTPLGPPRGGQDLSIGGGSPIVLPRSADAQVLADERRRAVYLYVSRHNGPVTVNEIADAFEIHRNAAKHHLDRLLEAGLLKAEFKRVNGRRGPGAGRPSKLYSPTDAEITFSLPERHYDLLAHLLLTAMTQGDDLEAVGSRYGRQLAEIELSEHADATPAEVVRTVLDGLGFRPSVDTDDEGHLWITTENCPFGWVAVEASEGQVCKLDRAIISGVLEGAGHASAVVPHTSIAGGQGTCVREAVPNV